MKTRAQFFLTLVIGLIFSLQGISQSVGVNTASPDASAVLDVMSSSKGMLVPRMTTAERMAIVSPATGLLVYDTNTQSFWFRYDSGWKNLLSDKSGWTLSGNAGTTPGTNFIGTTDLQAFRLRANNTDQLILNTNGSIQRDAGGNARGFNAIDLQKTRTMSSQVASANWSVVVGGDSNTGSGNGSFIGAGANNYAAGNYSSISAGENNLTAAHYCVIGGGLNNSAINIYDVIAGGTQNYIDAQISAIGGGYNNKILCDYSAIPGGQGLTLGPSARGSFGFLGGNDGLNNMTIDNPEITVFGNTDLWLANNDNVTSQLRFYEANDTAGLFPPVTTNYTSFRAGAQTTDLNYILPSTKTATNISKEVVLQLDTATNQMSWLNLSNLAYWTKNGNNGTTVGTNFLGTMDDEPLMFKVNNEESGYIDYETSKANTGFGYQTLESTTTGTGNTAAGYDALKSNINGHENTAHGHDALLTNSAGLNNTAIGSKSMRYNSTGEYNTAVGSMSLFSNVAGSHNVAIGTDAMINANNTSTPFLCQSVAVGYQSLMGSFIPSANTGIRNTAVGTFSLWINSSGTNNVAIGFGALSTNSSGSGNTALGNRALNTVTTTSNLVAVGDSSLYANTGNDNTAVGSRSLRSNMGGFNNTAVGREVLYSNTTGAFNTAIGWKALRSNTTGGGNLALGYEALFTNVAGQENTALGYQALRNMTSPGSTNNIGIGLLALRGSLTPANNTGINNIAVGGDALVNITSGNRNTIIGKSAFTDNTSGSDNTALGYNAGLTGATNNKVTLIGANTGTTVDNLTNATAIGYNAAVASSNTMVLGGTSTDAVSVVIGATSATANLDVTGTTSSDTKIHYINTSTGNVGLELRTTNAANQQYIDFTSGSVTNTGGGSPDFSYRIIASSTIFSLPGITLVKATGHVGIGVTPSKARLEVSGSQNFNIGNYGYLNNAGSVGTFSGASDYSIYATARIAGVEFNAFSDARIKKVIGRSDPAEDLITLMKVRITDYTYIDTISKDNKEHKKVIAQELEQIFPTAVNKMIDEIPDIFKLAEIKDGRIILSNNLKAGEKIKLILNERSDIFEVLEADANSFTVDASEEGKVFVYGRQVNDFRTVDYEALTTLSISAMQEQQMQIETLQKQNEQMHSDVETLQRQVAELILSKDKVKG